MAYARKYTDKQRAAVIELHTEGLSGPEIVARCAEGSATLEPFTIPRRSAAQIIETHERRRRRRLPQKLSDASDVELTERNRRAIEALVADQLERLGSRKKILSDADIKKIEQLRAVNERLRQSRPRTSKTSRVQGNGKGQRSALDGLAERMTQQEGTET